jgi:hypothetical protein
MQALWEENATHLAPWPGSRSYRWVPTLVLLPQQMTSVESRLWDDRAPDVALCLPYRRHIKLASQGQHLGEERGLPKALCVD